MPRIEIWVQWGIQRAIRSCPSSARIKSTFGHRNKIGKHSPLVKLAWRDVILLHEILNIRHYVHGCFVFSIIIIIIIIIYYYYYYVFIRCLLYLPVEQFCFNILLSRHYEATAIKEWFYIDDGWIIEVHIKRKNDVKARCPTGKIPETSLC